MSIPKKKTPDIIGRGPQHQRHRDEGVTSFFVGLISYSIFVDDEKNEHLCFRALESADHVGFEDDCVLQRKFPGGDARPCEFIQGTAEREFQEEVLLNSTMVYLNLGAAGARIVYQANTKDKAGRLTDWNQPGTHRKYFYLFPENKLVNYSTGKHFRLELMKERPGESGGPGGIIYPTQPILVPALYEAMAGNASWYHRQALVRAVHYLLKAEEAMVHRVPPLFAEFISELAKSDFANLPPFIKWKKERVARVAAVRMVPTTATDSSTDPVTYTPSVAVTSQPVMYDV